MSDLTLTPEDAMAMRFLRSAADAILARTELAQTVATLTDRVTELDTHVGTLADIRAANEARIADLQSRLDAANQQIGSLMSANDRLCEANDTLTRQRDGFASDLDYANSRIDQWRRDYESLAAEHLAQGRDLHDALHKLKVIKGAFGEDEPAKPAGGVSSPPPPVEPVTPSEPATLGESLAPSTEAPATPSVEGSASTADATSGLTSSPTYLFTAPIVEVRPHWQEDDRIHNPDPAFPDYPDRFPLDP